MKKKNTGQQKSQKCYISPIWGKAPLDRFDPKVAWWVMSTTESRVPTFKLKSSLVTILQGVEFSIFLLMFAWALQQCSANALPLALPLIEYFIFAKSLKVIQNETLEKGVSPYQYFIG